MGKRKDGEKENVQTPGEKQTGRQTVAGRESQEKASRGDGEETGGGRGGKGPLPPPPGVRPLQLGDPGP